MRGTQAINNAGHLMIGDVDTVDLAKTYGTPLYVYDTALIRERAEAFQKAFAKFPVKAKIAYASKAFSTIAMVQLVNECGLALDVVSGGELFTALKAGFPADRIHFHGNNKSPDELQFAINENVGVIIVDNFYELNLLQTLAAEAKQHVSIFLRMTPGVEAHTHEYIATGQEDSKFGFNLSNGDVGKAIQIALDSQHLELAGLHCHIGSQIFDVAGFILAIKRIYEHITKWSVEFGYVPDVLNVGGGFGISYTSEENPEPLNAFIECIVHTIMSECKDRKLRVPEIWIEPGRALVGEAGTTLYTVGSHKKIPNIREYLSVDGGMTDNLRPALYQSEYEAMVANRADQPTDGAVSVAGKCCESGDILIHDINLPTTKAGDVLAVFCTGAYGYAMANNYNRLPRPAVIFVEAGHAQLVVQRETYEDLVKLDLPLQKLARQK